ncbi:MAG TPA: SDR family oxidoreductase [Planctomycetota bacterium]|nr:SDR family oxidoreductase [Planctomycetota bacterium]
MRRALVFGGTGAVGREVLRAFAQAGIPTTFTYGKSAERARALASEYSQQALPVDLSDEAAVRALVRGLEETPTVFIHAAAILDSPLGFRAIQAVNVTSAFAAVEELAPRMARGGGGEIIFLGALDRTQSLPLPVAFAATQGALSAMAMAMARELGPRRIRVNLIAVGILSEGLSRSLAPERLEEFKTFSALRRVGTAAEVASAIRWLACDNTYMSGKVIPVNGGL